MSAPESSDGGEKGPRPQSPTLQSQTLASDVSQPDLPPAQNQGLIDEYACALIRAITADRDRTTNPMICLKLGDSEVHIAKATLTSDSELVADMLQASTGPCTIDLTAPDLLSAGITQGHYSRVLKTYESFLKFEPAGTDSRKFSYPNMENYSPFALVSCWHLGRSLKSVAFQDASIDTIRRISRDMAKLFFVLKSETDRLPRNTQLRKLMIDMAATYCDPSFLFELEGQFDGPTTFASEALDRFTRLLFQDGPPSCLESERCALHLHEEGAEHCYANRGGG